MWPCRVNRVATSHLGSGQLASFAAVEGVGKSIERLLQSCFVNDEPVAGKNTKAKLVRTEDFENKGARIPRPALSIFLYRVEINRTMRPSWAAVGSLDGRGHLPLDLHFLLTPWADNAESEYLVLGKTMECLEATPILSGPLLYEPPSTPTPPFPFARWAPNEAIQLIAEEITTEAVMRTFDSLEADYKLSVPYVARVVRVDTRVGETDKPVTSIVRGAAPSAEQP